jgi:glycosyltransferase involved in cell wall biosynthesis
MKIVHVHFDYDNSFQTERDLLEKYYTVTGWAEALQRNGADVVVINRFYKDSFLEENNVQYHFIQDSLPPKLKAWHVPLKLFQKIKALDVDVIHLHHLSLALQTYILRSLLKTKTALIIQHHGGPSPGKITKIIYDLLNRAADGYFFTDNDQGKQWFKRRREFAKVMSVMEGATFFDFAERNSEKTAVRNRNDNPQKTPINNSPVFLWAGNLIARKDPLTVLDGFQDLFSKNNRGTLFMVYRDGQLLEQVRQRINGSAILRERVHLIGDVLHREMESYYYNADYFVLGSHAEGSGYALSEALSCGCVPVVTDIPSFRMMTNNGQLGALWNPGNKNSFVEAATKAMNKNLGTEAQACINFYRQNLSFDAIAQTAIGHYKKVISNRYNNA